MRLAASGRTYERKVTNLREYFTSDVIKRINSLELRVGKPKKGLEEADNIFTYINDAYGRMYGGIDWGFKTGETLEEKYEELGRKHSS